MTPRWLPVIAAATPAAHRGRLLLIDQAIEEVDPRRFRAGDLVGLSIHTVNARRAYDLARRIKLESKATIVFGGVHATLFPQEALEHGADSVVTGDGEVAWRQLVEDFAHGHLEREYHGKRIDSTQFTQRPLWGLLRHDRYLMATVHTTRGCPERCSFCSVWVTDGRNVRLRRTQDVVDEVNTLYEYGFRAIVLADDNFYAVGEKNSAAREHLMDQRYELMENLATKTPDDVFLLTQTTIRTADDPAFLAAMRRAKVRGVLIGIESVEEASLQALKKDFNKTGQSLVEAVERMQQHGIFVLGSHIVGLPGDTNETYQKMLDITLRSNMFMAQFAKYTFFPGTVDYIMLQKGRLPVKRAKGMERYWLLDDFRQMEYQHPSMGEKDIAAALQMLWGEFYALRRILGRAWSIGMRAPHHVAAYTIFSKVFKNIYYGYGMSTDSARTRAASPLVRLLGECALRLFKRPAAVPPSQNAPEMSGRTSSGAGRR